MFRGFGTSLGPVGVEFETVCYNTVFLFVFVSFAYGVVSCGGVWRGSALVELKWLPLANELLPALIP